jgi:serine/threonine protein kinase
VIGRELDGRYRIFGKLGEGSMGEVYLVEHLGLGRKEALKILRSSMDDSPALVTRFRREARATNRLQHPNIVAVYDFGRLPDGRFYITTEYAKGENLDRTVRRLGTLPIPRALTILIQLAGAIDHAHSRGVIHRDLKPANLILGEVRGQRDVLKVLDFGVAKIIAPDYAESIATTGQGEVFGTPAYMAPEQIGANGHDPRIDLYAFGCIAFELVTGLPPYTGRTLQVLNAHLTAQVPRLEDQQPNIPVQLATIVARCLEKRPDDRPQSGAEIANALAGLRVGATALGVPSQPRRRSTRQAPWSNPSDFTVPDSGNRWVAEVDQTEVGDDGIEATDAEDDLSMAPTGFLDRSDARLAVDAVLMQLAEALLDLGDPDFRLTVMMANLAGARGALAAVADRMAELERSREASATRTLDSERRFRFAIGDLRFELEQARARGSINPDIEYQLAQLELRMAEGAAHAERELAAIDDRAITLAAARASHEEEMLALIASLEILVDEMAPRFQPVSQVAELTQRLARVRKAAGIAS